MSAPTQEYFDDLLSQVISITLYKGYQSIDNVGIDIYQSEKHIKHIRPFITTIRRRPTNAQKLHKTYRRNLEA